MNNKILKIGKIAFTVTQYFIYTIMVISLIIGVYLLMNQGANLPDWLDIYNKRIFLSKENGENDAVIPGMAMITPYLLQIEVLLLLTALIVGQIIQIINSVKKKAVFEKLNVSRLRKIGTLFLLIFFVNIFDNEIAMSPFSTIKFNFDPSYLLGSILAYIFAEIFSEGHKIQEENKLTI